MEPPKNVMAIFQKHIDYFFFMALFRGGLTDRYVRRLLRIRKPWLKIFGRGLTSASTTWINYTLIEKRFKSFEHSFINTAFNCDCTFTKKCNVFRLFLMFYNLKLNFLLQCCMKITSIQNKPLICGYISIKCLMTRAILTLLR